MFRIAKDNNIQAPLARTARSVRKKISEIKCFKKKTCKDFFNYYPYNRSPRDSEDKQINKSTRRKGDQKIQASGIIKLEREKNTRALRQNTFRDGKLTA